jgi:hypothetical protein
LPLITLNDTHTHTHRSPVDEKSARCRQLYLTTHGTRHRHIRVSLRPAGFETAVSTIERPYTNTLNLAAVGISHLKLLHVTKFRIKFLHLFIIYYCYLQLFVGKVSFDESDSILSFCLIRINSDQ